MPKKKSYKIGTWYQQSEHIHGEGDKTIQLKRYKKILLTLLQDVLVQLKLVLNFNLVHYFHEHSSNLTRGAL